MSSERIAITVLAQLRGCRFHLTPANALALMRWERERRYERDCWCDPDDPIHGRKGDCPTHGYPA